VATVNPGTLEVYTTVSNSDWTPDPICRIGDIGTSSYDYHVAEILPLNAGQVVSATFYAGTASSDFTLDRLRFTVYRLVS
jgi:hypothetical protein